MLRIDLYETTSIVLAGALLGFGLLGQEDGLDVGEDTSLGNGDSGQELVQLLVIADGQLQVPWNDPGLLVVTGSIACQFEDLGGQVFHNRGQVNWSSGTHTFSIVAFAQEAMNSTHGELESCPG